MRDTDPNLRKLSITYYPSIYDTDTYQTETLDWASLCHKFGSHTEFALKTQAPGFGAHALLKPAHPCTKHLPNIKASGHRCGACVDNVSFFVFDVDTGSLEDVGACDELLRADGLALLWYTSYSYSPKKPSFRLLIPTTRDMTVTEYGPMRLAVLRKYKIPADPLKCSAPAHFWYQPSCPKDAARLVDTSPGVFLDVDELDLQGAFRPATTNAACDPDWTPPPEPPEGTAVNLEPLKAKLESHIRRLLTNPEKRDRGLVLRRVLDGQSLAPHGGRNQTTLIATATLAFLFPGTPLGVLMLLIRPSLQAMIRDGSKLNESKVERMFLTAMRRKADSDAVYAEERQALMSQADEIRERLRARALAAKP